MAQLIPIDPKSITAIWSSSLSKLTVTAKSIPARWATADFKRVVEFTGGRKLRLEGFAGGGNPDALPFDKTYTEDKITVKPSFSKIFVVHADLTTKKESTSEIVLATDAPAPTPVPAQPDVPIVALKPQPIPIAQSKIDTSAVVLQPIGIDLLNRNFVRIMTPIPNPAVFRSNLDARNEADSLIIWRSGVMQGQAYWDVAWSRTVDASTKTTFTVTTTQGAVNQANGPNQITVQQYVVQAASSNPRPMVDLSDPNA